MLVANNIVKTIAGNEILKNVSLEINQQEIVAIVGPSGAGKTTLLQILGTLLKPNAGELLINGEDILKLKGKKLSHFRGKNLGFVFQFHQLLAEFTALENVMLPALIIGTNKKTAEDKAKEILEKLGLTKQLSQKPASLSGGEKQRVAVARALINDPKLILADEPTGSLDTENATDMYNLFTELKDMFKPGIVMVTHNKELAQFSDKQIHIKDGILID